MFTAIHELGHAIVGLIKGYTITRFVVHPFLISHGMLVEFLDANRLSNTTIGKFQEDIGRRFMPYSIQPIKGWVKLPDVPGLGLDPDLDLIEEYRRSYDQVFRKMPVKFQSNVYPFIVDTVHPFLNNMFTSL